MSNVVNEEDIIALLESKYLEYNKPEFIETDPVFVPHQFTRKEDIEISGFLTALIAWGRRPSILENGMRMMKLMDMKPYEFVMYASEDELSCLSGFVHRTFNDIDLRAIVLSLRNVYLNHGGLERIFSDSVTPYAKNVFSGIVHARYVLIQHVHFPRRTHKHVANPAKGSAAKRINMFLRWMVRNDRQGVDFGLWEGIEMSQLICPLDVHTGNVSRKLGLVERKQNDWKTACMLTDRLKKYCPHDPVKYDYSLFGLGVFEHF